MGSGLSAEHDDTPTAATKKIAASALQGEAAGCLDGLAGSMSFSAPAVLGAVTKAQSEQAMITAFRSFDSEPRLS